ncbi:hypothetical protein PAT3040_00396 [Paenibacillus agaridevorans]|uniref:Uncharacterized protein n=2 Tax=Paenibacillus agaridevorans TaxID=171404 RepID=A0A2R5ER88_9BACL|nr:hypothetical protein PAT3040_00396 [Paenibacillus agaridevorans]
MQWINYQVVWKMDIDDASRALVRFMDKLDELSELADKQLERWGKEQKSSGKLTAKETSGVFASYLAKKGKFYEYSNVLNILIKEVEEDNKKSESNRQFGHVAPHYYAPKELVNDYEIDQAASLITEGKPVYDYPNKLKETREIIRLFNEYGGRECYPNSLQDIKVYFREFFMSKVGYRGKNAMSIIRDYVEEIKCNDVKPFVDKAHYLFVREKISRGYFREKGKLDLYIQKAKVHQKLDNTVLKLYQFYDYEWMMDFLYELNDHLFAIIHETSNEVQVF